MSADASADTLKILKYYDNTTIAILLNHHMDIDELFINTHHDNNKEFKPNEIYVVLAVFAFGIVVIYLLSLWQPTTVTLIGRT